MAYEDGWRFFRGYLRAPDSVGAIAPSSPALARALCAPLAAAQGPVRILEVGAGTGAVTRQIGQVQRPQDRLDVCEINPAFAEVLQTEILARPPFDEASRQGRVRLLRQPVQELTGEGSYDYVICGLPFTAFPRAEVEAILATIRRLMCPEGVFSYFEYVGLRWVGRHLSRGKNRARLREVSPVLTKQIREHQVSRRTVWLNLPPAHARHLCFASPAEAESPAPTRSIEGSNVVT